MSAGGKRLFVDQEVGGADYQLYKRVKAAVALSEGRSAWRLYRRQRSAMTRNTE